MNRWRTRPWRNALACTVTACLAMVSAGQSPPPDVRHITIDVRLQAPDGSPIEGIPMALLGSGLPRIKTNAVGLAHIVADVPASAARCWVGPLPSTSDTYYQGRNADIARYQEIANRYWIGQELAVSLVEGQSSYQATVQAAEGVHVRGRFVDAVGVPTQRLARAVISSTQDECPVDSEERFVSGAIQKDHPAELYVYVRPGTRVMMIPISAQQAAQDLDLGDIVLPARASGRKVDITVNNLDAVRSTIEDPSPRQFGVTFVSTNGQSVEYMRLRGNGKGWVAPPNAANDPCLPPGEYFACPGSLDGLGETKHLLDVARQPGGADILRAANVPTILVPADGGTEPVSMSFDARQAVDAVKTVP